MCNLINIHTYIHTGETLVERGRDDVEKEVSVQ